MKARIWRILKLQYNLQGYLNSVQMSGRKHLLVEGKYDRQFFRIFLDTFISHIEVDIDTAENLSSPEIVGGNCQKVEKVAETISSKEYAARFVGFVDREYREFDLQEITDKLGCHNQISRLVWSRGHSIENYFFTHQIVKESLLDLCYTDSFDKAIVRFMNCFEDTIRIACALGLTGHQMRKSEVIRNSICSDLIHFEGTRLVFKINNWKELLVSRQQSESENIVYCFENWLNRLESINLETLQWLCDGHSGLFFVLDVYHRCVYTDTANSDNRKKEADKIYQAAKDIGKGTGLFHKLARCFNRNALDDRCIYPQEVLRLLEER
jgi:hypothetical protein